MKKINLFFMAALLFGMAACTNEKEIVITPEGNAGKTFITASIADNSGTKLSMDGADGKLYWEKGDELMVLVGSGDSFKAQEFTAEGDTPSSTMRFSGELDMSNMGQDDYIYGIHPISPVTEISGGSVKIPLTNGLSKTQFLGGTIGYYKAIPNSLPNYGETFPMVARSKNANLKFYNVCGGLAIKVAHEGLIGVVVKNNDGRPVWGVMDVGFDEEGKPVMNDITVPNNMEAWPKDEFWVMDNGYNYDYFLAPGQTYYAILPPMTYTQGLTITYRTASTSATYKIDGSVDIQRSVFSRLTNRDANLEFVPNEGNIEFMNANFKQYCIENFDTNGDGEISYAEALAVKVINVQNAATMGNIGQELMFFENLEIFIWRGANANSPGPLQSIPNYWWPKLKQIDCSYNNIHNSVVLSCNPELITVNLRNNEIPSLILGELPNLEYLGLTYNKLSSIDLSGCPNLTTFYCVYNNLQSLDLSNNPNLQTLSAYGNPELTTLDVSKCGDLEYLACVENNMTALTLGQHPKLATLYCYGNNLQSLDLSGCPALDFLSCYQNNLQSLDLSANTALVTAYVSYNPLEAIDVSKNTELEVLFCCINKLSSLDVSKLTKLKRLRCFGNNLGSLDVSQNPELYELSIGGNPMTEIDVSNNPELIYFEAIYDEDWGDYQAPYNTYTSPLKYIYVAENQQIDEVTFNRYDTSTTPFRTIVGTKAQIAAGHFHDNLFGEYTATAYMETSKDVYENEQWPCGIGAFDGDQTVVWLSDMFCLIHEESGSFSGVPKMIAFVRGDGGALFVPTPQDLGINAPSLGVTDNFSLYLWYGDFGITNGGSLFLAHDGITLTRQEDGSFKDIKWSFGFSDDVTLNNNIGVRWYGQVAFVNEEHPFTLTRNQ